LQHVFLRGGESKEKLCHQKGRERGRMQDLTKKRGQLTGTCARAQLGGLIKEKLKKKVKGQCKEPAAEGSVRVPEGKKGTFDIEKKKKQVEKLGKKGKVHKALSGAFPGKKKKKDLPARNAPEQRDRAVAKPRQEQR